ncbi:MAG: penicillin-binding protein [Flavobacteriales bacterium]
MNASENKRNTPINQPHEPVQAPIESVPGHEVKGKKQLSSLIHNKAWMVFAGLCLLAIAIIVKVFVIQLFPDEKAQQLAEGFTYKVREIQPVRGQIYSSDGSLMATSIPEYEIRWDAKAPYDEAEYKSKLDSMCESFASLFGDRSAAQYKAVFKKAKNEGNRYVEIIDHVDYNQLQLVKKFPFVRNGTIRGGLVFEEKFIREQPFGTLASRTIGMERAENKVGIERDYDELLRGKKGAQMMEKIAGGVWKPMNNEFVEVPEPGADIITTIDVHLQDVAHAALKKKLEEADAEWGCAILMEVQTGFVRAVANLSRNNRQGEFSERLNYAISQSIEPGSTMKLASLMACMDEGLVKLDDKVETGNGVVTFHGKPMKDSNWDKGGNGTITAEQVFEKSSNVGTALLVKKSFGNDPQRYLDKLHSFGLGESLGITLSGEASPRLYKTTKDNGWSGLSLTQMAIGYETTCTPLQTLAFYNAVANNGVLVKPQFVQEVRRNGQIIEKAQPVALRQKICKDETLAQCRKMMEGVTEEGGTASRQFNECPYTVAGKTGTAWLHEDGGYQAHHYRASFVGYFPAENPRYTCIVVVNDPRGALYYGSLIAAPVFKELADKIYSTELDFHAPSQRDSTKLVQHHLPRVKSGSAKELNTVFARLNMPVYTDGEGQWYTTVLQNDSLQVSPRIVESGVVPNVLGMGLQDALYLLESQGMHVNVSGFGTVRRQSIPAGSHIPSNSNITIELL